MTAPAPSTDSVLPDQLIAEAVEAMTLDQDALAQIMADTPGATSVEVEEVHPADTGSPDRAELMADLDVPPEADESPIIRRAMELLYGETFPLLNKDATEADWGRWAESLWDRHTASMETRLHFVERNRLFRRGHQWISSQRLSSWKEPAKPRDTARMVKNVIAPALDQRVQLNREQRPGFQTRPATYDPDDMKKAEAKQIGLEYQWDQQRMPIVMGELSYWAGTDGVAFCELVWDPERGPWHEAYGLAADGQGRSPMGSNGEPAQKPYRFPMGDIEPRVRRIEQVRVSADATRSKKPWYWVLRDQIPTAQAIREYGPEVAEADGVEKGDRVDRLAFGSLPSHRLTTGRLVPGEEDLLIEQDTVDRITVYCEPSEFLPKGLHFVSVGRKVVYQNGLLWGCVPVIPFTDGSTDPAFFPSAIMDNWVETQQRINAVLSKWVENVRYNAGPRILAKTNAIKGETLVGGTMSVVEVAGMGTLRDSAQVVEGFSLAQDAVGLFNLELKTFEDLSGWNQVSRGQFSSEQSGRAILAIRESLERVFAPTVQAASDFAVEWAKKACAGMQWGYTLPRVVGVMGKSRPDLARALQADDFDGVIDVFVDPETMMPMPRALKLFLLKEMLQMQLISPQEYLRRSPFAEVRGLDSPDRDHMARARRCVEALRQGQQLPILWQDNEAIHQDVLERELILPDDVDPMLRQMAQMRWDQLGQQMGMKQQAMAATGMMTGAPSPGGPAQPGQEGPAAGGSSASPAGPVLSYGGSDAQAAAGEFDQRSPG